jgi:hypothetical protein
LESVCRGNSTEGSNPSLSANKILNKSSVSREIAAVPVQSGAVLAPFSKDERAITVNLYRRHKPNCLGGHAWQS